ncbi:MAG: universal stress protein [Microthrixaceae bacterium]|nr:universal stress protein [Microthrixaceae bacterium]MCB1011888.1 universal stress protein [Microthrixaceae bacterium]MCO5322620.1 universal stress protein [Microthrixaceae bacterium]
MHALIATDGSEVSIDAAKKGVALLNPTKVTLLTVADTSIAEDSGAGGFEGNLLSPAESERARQVILEEGTNELTDTAGAVGLDPAIVDRRVVEGASGQMIIHVADEVDADVIVVGSHGHGFLSRVLIGSVSEYVVRHTQRPVLVVRHDDDNDDNNDKD